MQASETKKILKSFEINTHRNDAMLDKIEELYSINETYNNITQLFLAQYYGLHDHLSIECKETHYSLDRVEM